jgi:hypothetical protein
MKNRNPQVDAYIAKSADFAQPILTKARNLFHKACPDIEEAMKWSVPHFVHDGIVGAMAAFKQHVSVSFWKGKQLAARNRAFNIFGDSRMCALKVTKPADLPPDKLFIDLIKEAVKLNEEDTATQAAAAKARTRAGSAKAKSASAKNVQRTVNVPTYFRAALKENPMAKAVFDAFSYSHKKEYVEWITEAKREETRNKRMQQALAWMAEGKPRNWKYMKT